MLPLVSPLYLKILVSRPLNDIFSQLGKQNSEDFPNNMTLNGIHSKLVKEAFMKLNKESSILTWKIVSTLFCSPTGLENLWNLLLVIKDKEVDFSVYKTGILHRKHITKLTIARALEKELANVSFFGTGVIASGKQDNVDKAAEYHLLTGNLKKYCELKIQLGQWSEALALAPGISLSYWNELTRRWLSTHNDENNEFTAPLLVASHKYNDLIEYYLKQNFLEKAYIASVAVSEDSMPSEYSIDETKIHYKTEEIEHLVSANIQNLGERYILCGYPIIAACWYLSDGNIETALYSLLRGHELELAISVCLSLEIYNLPLKRSVTYLSWRCAQVNEWDLAIDILNLHPDTQDEKINLCINCHLSTSEKNSLHQKVGLPSLDECKERAEEELKEGSSILKIVQYYLLSGEIKKGLDLGLTHVKEKLCELKYNIQYLFELLTAMSCVNYKLLQDNYYDRHRFELQVYAAYVGAQIAIRQGFNPIVAFLFSTALSLIRKVHNANLSLTEEQITSEMHAWVVSRSTDSDISESDKTIYNELMAKVSEDMPFGDIGITVVSGSNLPRHSDHHRCYFRGSAIQGPVYFLDDSKSAISLNDALMWAKVNRFSPMKTGKTINPF